MSRLEQLKGDVSQDLSAIVQQKELSPAMAKKLLDELRAIKSVTKKSLVDLRENMAQAQEVQKIISEQTGRDLKSRKRNGYDALYGNDTISAIASIANQTETPDTGMVAPKLSTKADYDSSQRGVVSNNPNMYNNISEQFKTWLQGANSDELNWFLERIFDQNGNMKDDVDITDLIDTFNEANPTRKVEYRSGLERFSPEPTRTNSAIFSRRR